MILTMDLLSHWFSWPGSTSCRNSPVSLQYSRTNPAASPTKNFLLLQPNQAAVMWVSWLFQLSLVKTFSRFPETRLQTLTSLELNRNMQLVAAQTLKSKTEWNSLISLDFFSREGALNWVIFFSQTRHSDSSGMIYSREGLMKFFSQLITCTVTSRRKSQIRIDSLSSKDSTQGNERRNLAARRLPLCSLYFPEKPFERETSREQTEMAGLNPQASRQLPNSLVQSIPRTPFLCLLLTAETVLASPDSSTTVFLRQTEQNLTLPSIEAVAMQRGSYTSASSVMRPSCCLRERRGVQSMRVLLRQATEASLISPCFERKAHCLCSGRYCTLWKPPSRLLSTSLQVLTLPCTLKLQKRAPASNSAQKTMFSLSKSKSAMKECPLQVDSCRQSTSLKAESQMRTVLAPASSRQQRWSLATYTIFRTQLAVPGSTTALILYQLETLEQAEEMTSFSWKDRFLQLGRSTLRMFSMMYQVNSDHSRWPSPLMSMAWKNLMRSATKQYLLSSFQGEQSRFMRQMKVGSSRPLGYSSNYRSRISMFQCDSIDIIRSM